VPPANRFPLRSSRSAVTSPFLLPPPRPRSEATR